MTDEAFFSGDPLRVATIRRITPEDHTRFLDAVTGVDTSAAKYVLAVCLPRFCEMFNGISEEEAQALEAEGGAVRRIYIGDVTREFPAFGVANEREINMLAVAMYMGFETGVDVYKILWKLSNAVPVPGKKTTIH